MVKTPKPSVALLTSTYITTKPPVTHTRSRAAQRRLIKIRIVPCSQRVYHAKLKVTTGRVVLVRVAETIVCCACGGCSLSNLPFAGSHLQACHSASNMEFAAPFGTAKKGKAAQVEEVQPMASDLSSCSL